MPTTTPKAIPTATIHRGSPGGRISGYSSPVTKKPSLISSFRRTANSSSIDSPVTYVTTIIAATRQPKR
ncbi:MAG TPA: hypothetical protein VM389_14565 [Phycisphaerae bacterium]|nr:hypothetical protein [Phycisphaerae bacterium]